MDAGTVFTILSACDTVDTQSFWWLFNPC